MATNDEDIKAQVDILTYLYHESSDETGISNKEVLQNDITELFLRALRQKIAGKNLITITIHGETTQGKSTIGLELKRIINAYIRKIGLNGNIDEYQTICSDQLEFNRAIMREQTNVCYLIDEFSDLGQSGENSSTEANLFQFWSHTCAQKFIHRIQCTPKNNTIYDWTSPIVLEVIGRDDKKMTTLCKVLYNNAATGISTPLGIININVKETLTAEWHARYRRKKFARMALLDQFGVKDVRELEFSAITLEAYEKLKEVAYDKVPNEMITLTVTGILRQRKLFFSIIGKTNVEQPIRALLGTYTVIKKNHEKMTRPMDNVKYLKLQEVTRAMQKQLDESISAEQRNVKTLEDYQKIE